MAKAKKKKAVTAPMAVKSKKGTAAKTGERTFVVAVGKYKHRNPNGTFSMLKRGDKVKSKTDLRKQFRNKFVLEGHPLPRTKGKIRSTNALDDEPRETQEIEDQEELNEQEEQEQEVEETDDEEEVDDEADEQEEADEDEAEEEETRPVRKSSKKASKKKKKGRFED